MATRRNSSSSKTTGRAAKKSSTVRERDSRTRAGARKGAGNRKTAGKSASAKSGFARTASRSRKGAASEGRGRTTAGRAAQANAISLLMQDHDRVEDMLDKFERARSDPQKQQLADRICEELTLHAEVEEEVFYPAVREAIDDEDLMDEAEVEHATAKELIAQIQSGKVGDPQWEAKVKVLGEYVKHHVKEEEREMFPKARKAKLDLRALGEQIQARKAGGQGSAMSRQSARGGGNEHRGRTEQEGNESREPGLIESAVRTLLPGGR